MASGSIQNFDGNIWHELKLKFKDYVIEAFIDGNSIAKVSNDNQKSGYVLLASSYNANLFDNLEVGP